MKYLFLLILAFAPISCSDVTEDVIEPKEALPKTLVPDWVYGKWEYQDDKGKKTEVALYPDGTALASDQSIGSWFYDGDIHIVWMSGWQDLIKKGSPHVKLGYAPGVATSDFPTNKSTATKLSSEKMDKD